MHIRLEPPTSGRVLVMAWIESRINREKKSFSGNKAVMTTRHVPDGCLAERGGRGFWLGSSGGGKRIWAEGRVAKKKHPSSRRWRLLARHRGWRTLSPEGENLSLKNGGEGWPTLAGRRFQNPMQEKTSRNQKNK